MPVLSSYRDLIVWQKAMDLIVAVYKISNDFPQREMYGLTSQIRRAAISIPSNIAEDRRRGTRRDYHHFLRIAFGSGAELETQLEIARRLKYARQTDFSIAESLLSEVMKMLNVMTASLKT